MSFNICKIAKAVCQIVSIIYPPAAVLMTAISAAITAYETLKAEHDQQKAAKKGVSKPQTTLQKQNDEQDDKLFANFGNVLNGVLKAQQMKVQQSPNGMQGLLSNGNLGQALQDEAAKVASRFVEGVREARKSDAGLSYANAMKANLGLLVPDLVSEDDCTTKTEDNITSIIGNAIDAATASEAGPAETDSAAPTGGPRPLIGTTDLPGWIQTALDGDTQGGLPPSDSAGPRGH